MKKIISIILMTAMVLSTMVVSIGATSIDENNVCVAPVFYGTQKRTNDNGTIDVRFVSVTDSLEGTKLGYEIVASWWDENSKNSKQKTYSADNGHSQLETNVIYSSIYAGGESIVASDIGKKIGMEDAKGIFAVAINGVPDNIDVLFSVKTYVKDSNYEIVEMTSENVIMYSNGERNSDRIVYYETFDDVELDVDYSDGSNTDYDAEIADKLGWTPENYGAGSPVVKTTDDGKLNLRGTVGAERGYNIITNGYLNYAQSIRISADIAINSLGLFEFVFGSTYNARVTHGAAQFRAYSDAARSAQLGAEAQNTEASYVGLNAFNCGGLTGSDLGLEGYGWGQTVHFTVDIDLTSNRVSFYAGNDKIFENNFNSGFDGGITILMRECNVTLDNLLITVDVADINVGSTPISEYSIIYGDSQSQEYAEKIGSFIGVVTGENIPVVEDTVEETENEIIVGITNRNPNDSLATNGYRVIVQGSQIRLLAEDDVSAEMLCAYMITKYYETNTQDTFDLASIATEFDGSESIRMMTFNVWNAWEDDASDRAKQISDMILRNDLDIVCLQEYDIKFRNSKYGSFMGFIGGENLNNLISDRFTEVSVSGVDSKYVWNPIFYNKNKYEVVESGFSDMYAEGINCLEYDYPSGGDGRTHFRTLVWAILKDKSTNELFLVGNTHFSATSNSTDGGDHNAESAYVMSKLAEVRARYSDAITLVAGDYNSTVRYGACKNMIDAGYHNSLSMADYKGRNNNNIIVGNQIDNILTVSDIDVYAAVALYEGNIAEMSDHLPIVIQFCSKSTIGKSVDTQQESQMGCVNWIS